MAQENASGPGGKETEDKGSKRQHIGSPYSPKLPGLIGDRCGGERDAGLKGSHQSLGVQREEGYSGVSFILSLRTAAFLASATHRGLRVRLVLAPAPAYPARA